MSIKTLIEYTFISIGKLSLLLLIYIVYMSCYGNYYHADLFTTRIMRTLDP